MPINKIALRDYKGDNSAKQHQQQAFSNINQQTDLFRSFTDDLRGMMYQSFGQRQQVFNLLQDNLTAASSYGPGQLNADFFAQNGFLPGEAGGAGGGSGGGGGGGTFQERVARARAEREAASASGTPKPWDWQVMSGYNPSLYNPNQFVPRRFYASEGAALRSQLTEQATDSYGDAAAAFGQRALQQGGYGAGIEAAALREMEAEKASAQMEGQRQAILFGAQNIRDDMRAFAGPRAQLQIAHGDALAREAQMQNAIAAQKAAQQHQAAENARARAAAQRAAGAAARQAQQQWSAAQRQRASEFGAEMRLKQAQFNSENFFRSIGAMSGLAGQMDPTNYGQLALGGLGGPMNAWTNIYNSAGQRMQQQGSPWWQKALGAAAGGALTYFTGGLAAPLAGSVAGAIGGWGGGGGGGGYLPSSPWGSPYASAWGG